MRRMVPDAPKSIVAVARGPVPSAATTVPRPYLSWLTRSPTARVIAGVSCQPLNGVDRMPPDAMRACAESPPVRSERLLPHRELTPGAGKDGAGRRPAVSPAGRDGEG